MAVSSCGEIRFPQNTLNPECRHAESISGALGGEVLLVRFQIVNDTYCSYCLAFGLCVLVLFAVNFPRMNKMLALGAFGAGVGAFWLFFRGTILPLYY